MENDYHKFFYFIFSFLIIVVIKKIKKDNNYKEKIKKNLWWQIIFLLTRNYNLMKMMSSIVAGHRKRTNRSQLLRTSWISWRLNFLIKKMIVTIDRYLHFLSNGGWERKLTSWWRVSHLKERKMKRSIVPSLNKEK